MFINDRIKINPSIKNAKNQFNLIKNSKNTKQQTSTDATSIIKQALSELDAYYNKHKHLGRIVKWVDHKFGSYKTLCKYIKELTPLEGIDSRTNMPIFRTAKNPNEFANIPVKASNYHDIRGRKWVQADVINRYLHKRLIRSPNIKSHISMMAGDYITYHFLNMERSQERHIHRKLQSELDLNPKATSLSLFLSYESHITTILIDRNLRTVEFFDSLVNFGSHDIRKKFLNSIADSMNELDSDSNKPPYRVIEKIKKKLQHDGYQCGIWAAFFLENRLLNPDVDFKLLNPKKCQTLIADHRIYLQELIIDEAVDQALNQFKQTITRESYLVG